MALKNGVNKHTVLKWRRRDFVEDAPTGSKDLRSTAVSLVADAACVAVRRHARRPLDDCLKVLREAIPDLSRFSLHRCFHRHETHRLPEVHTERGGKGTLKVHAIVLQAVTGFGGVHVLVDNAGGLISRGRSAEMALERWYAVLELNLTGAFLIFRACLARMKTGVTGNPAGLAGRVGGGPCAVAKGAIMSMRRRLAKELGPEIRVHALCPGKIDKDFDSIDTAVEARRGFEDAAPVKRQGSAEDVASLVLCRACEDSAFISGANIGINGGELCS